MTQILLVEPDSSLRSILKLNLMKNLGCDVIDKETAEDAINLLAILPDIDLIISREKCTKEDAALKLVKYLEKNKSSIPLLIIGKKIGTYQNESIIDPMLSWKEIVKRAGNLLGQNIDFNENRLVNAFVPVGLHYFLNINSINAGCDIYLRVKKNNEEFQYIKRLHSGDQFARADIEKYRDSGLKEFYISKDQFSQFVNFVTEQLVMKMLNPRLHGEEKIQLSDEVYEVTMDRIHSLGIDNHTIEIVEESIRSMQNSLGENDALSSFLKSLQAKKLSYAYSHSYLTALILHKIVNHFDWESAAVKEKLTFVAYFHDISLQDSLLMKINTFADFEKADLKKEERKKILNHALDSANLVERFPKIPNGVATILKEHHGSKSGIGFTETLSIAIAPISMMFMVVEHFVDEYLNMKETDSKNLEKIFRKMHRKFNKVTYQQTVVALENMVQKKHKQAS